MRGGLLPQKAVAFEASLPTQTRDQRFDEDLRELTKVPRPFLLTGLVDKTAKTGRTDGIQFTASGYTTIDHGCGVEIVAFLEVPMAGETTTPGLVPAYTSTIDPTKQIRVQATRTAKAWLLLFPRAA